MLCSRGLRTHLVAALAGTLGKCGWMARMHVLCSSTILRAPRPEMLQLKRERPNSAHVYIRLAMVYLASPRLEEARALMPPALAADALLAPLTFIGISAPSLLQGIRCGGGMGGTYK